MYKDRIREFLREGRLSDGKRAVAEFFINSSEDAAFLTLTELSERIGVSASTISRTAVEMGFEGYPGLQEEIRLVVKRGVTPVERLKHAPSGADQPLWKQSMLLDRDNMQHILSMNAPEMFDAAIESLATAPRVFSLAMRSSYPLTFFFDLLLNQMRPGARHLSLDDGRLAESVFDMEPGDVLFVVSFPRYTKLTLDIAEKVRRIGCDIVSITDGELSPLALLSKAALFCPYDSVSFFNSNTAAQAIINALLAGIRVRLGEEGIRRLRRHGDVLKEWSVLGVDEKNVGR